PWEPMFVNNGEDSRDSMLDEAIEVVRKTGRASASMLQRRLRVGYPRAASIIDQLEEIGVIGPAMSGGRDREVLIGDEDDDLDDASERAEGKRFENSHPLADEDDSDLNEV
ncbi:MAG: hypothetical protein JW750_09040, partial [Anaerolineaceae bacterium]|nr:hypothetical protein [Anaerolineaceae bacterium]